MKRLHTLPAAILAVLLLACLVAVYVTRDSAPPRPAPVKSSASGQTLPDSRLLETATQMAARAETADEQNQAREALHLADHELDLAFAAALRDAAAYRAPSTGPLRDLIANINQLTTQITADQARIAQLTKPGASSGDQLDLAKARLALDQDELEDARQDLARQGGDPHSALARALQAHEASQHQTAQAFKSAGARPTGTLVQQTGAWFSLNSLVQQLLA